jgi:membrane protease YdiL (CAAX protease family)
VTKFLSVFYNHSEGRLRAAWRLLIGILLAFLVLGFLNELALFIITLLLLITAQIPFSALGKTQGLTQAINAAFAKLPILAGFRALIILVLVGLAFVLLARWIDRRSWRDFGLHFNPTWWRELGIAIFVGMVLVGVVFGIEYLFGWASVSGFFRNDQPKLSFWQLLVDGFLGFVLVGVREELFFRGYLMKNLAEGLNLPRISSKTALLVSYLLISLVFGFLHAFNQNATLVSSLNLVLAGLFLGLGYVLTSDLAIPIGLHIGWNFAQGYIFGFPVSGATQPLALIATQQTGPTVWTGGAFGPEGGLMGVFAFLLGLLLVYVWVRLTRPQASLQSELALYSPLSHGNRKGQG